MNAGGDLLLVYVPDILELCPVSRVDLEEMLAEVLKSIALGFVIKLINGVLEEGPVLGKLGLTWFDSSLEQFKVNFVPIEIDICGYA